MLKSFAVSALAILLTATSALALTITNTDSNKHKVGIDMGAKERIETIGAGKTVKIKGCEDGCGITGPWDYSIMAKATDKLETDGKSKRYK